ncbi:hypothetical protein GTA08_BOTSDO05557 [Botryosphaeria dothidea]|uniref:Uncharacterized protein n=1 Tax=Botryosphaeria dothidea TaxID=55169 RepID=A0A8H4ITC0_9PEZI|nr:hypothetical protein GTA08_BOTSDO05557 [Botryosphaeria dothidea]
MPRSCLLDPGPAAQQQAAKQTAAKPLFQPPRRPSRAVSFISLPSIGAAVLPPVARLATQSHHPPYLVRAHTQKKRHEPAHEPLLSPNTHFKPHDQRRRETPNSPVILRLDPSLDMVAFP